MVLSLDSSPSVVEARCTGCTPHAQIQNRSQLRPRRHPSLAPASTLPPPFVVDILPQPLSSRDNVCQGSARCNVQLCRILLSAVAVGGRMIQRTDVLLAASAFCASLLPSEVIMAAVMATLAGKYGPSVSHSSTYIREVAEKTAGRRRSQGQTRRY